MQEFEILGQKIVVSDSSETEIASIAVDLVNEEIDQIRKSKPFQGPQQVAVLALLQIAAKLIRERQLMDQYRNRLDERFSDLMKDVTALVGVQMNQDEKSA